MRVCNVTHQWHKVASSNVLVGSMVSAAGFALQEAHTINYEVTAAAISHTEMQHIADTRTSRTTLYCLQINSGLRLPGGHEILSRQLSTHGRTGD